MALNVFLGIWDEDKLRRVKVDDVDLDSNVDILKPHLTKELGENAPEEFGMYSHCIRSIRLRNIYFRIYILRTTIRSQ